MHATCAPAFPKSAPRRLDAWPLDDARARSTLRIAAPHTAPRCPGCDAPARHVPSGDTRTLAARPWRGAASTGPLRGRTRLGHTPQGPRRSVTERRPGLVTPWARRTVRLMAPRFASALARGGAAGARLSRT